MSDEEDGWERGNHPAFRGVDDQNTKEKEKTKDNELVDEMRRRHGVSGNQSRKISDRETDYQREGKLRQFDKQALQQDGSGEFDFKKRMEQQLVENEQEEVYRKIQKKQQEEAENAEMEDVETDSIHDRTPVLPRQRKSAKRWDETPLAGSQLSSQSQNKRSRWDETPLNVGGSGAAGEGQGSRWDQTPIANQTPLAMNSTPVSAGLAAHTPLTAELANQLRWEQQIERRNRPMTDAELDELLPKTGFKVVPMPTSYKPIRTPARKLLATPTPFAPKGGIAAAATTEGGQGMC